MLLTFVFLQDAITWVKHWPMSFYLYYK
jgi:hypothetical protein